MLALDVSQRIKAGLRYRDSLAPSVASAASASFDEVVLFVGPGQREQVGALPEHTTVLEVPASSDTRWEELGLRRWLCEVDATAVVVFRESVRVPPGVHLHLHLHEDPRLRAAVLRQRQQSVRQRLHLAWRNNTFERRLPRVDSLTTSSHWALQGLRDRPKIASLEAVQQARVVHLGGLPDALCGLPPLGHDERTHVLSFVSDDPRDDEAFAVNAYACATANGRSALPLEFAGAATHVPAAGTPLGWISNDELLDRYRRAAAVITTSSFEGFGLQVVEAMQAGTPVLCPAGTALDEVGGPAVCADPAQAGSRLVRLLDEPARWAAEQEACLSWSERFRWSSCGRELVDHLLRSEGDTR